MIQDRLKKSISGERSGWTHSVTRLALGCLEPVYRLAIRRRNAAFDRDPARSTIRVPVPVISVGNLTTGGTGKTPMVCWMIRMLMQAGRNAAIVSRGYGRRNDQPNDEANELGLYLPDAPHVQNPDRVVAARQAIARFQADCIVMDDGFQHRRLHRDLDVVLIDATCPFGFGHLLPRGLLREPITSLDRADAVIITRVNQVSDKTLQRIRNQIESRVPENRIALVEFVPDEWRDSRGGAHGIQRLQGNRIVAFCGIGNPQAFRSALTKLPLELLEFVIWPDHYPYGSADLERLTGMAHAKSATALVCTVKDLVKIRELPAVPVPVWGLAQRVEFVEGESMLLELVRQSMRNR